VTDLGLKFYSCEREETETSVSLKRQSNRNANKSSRITYGDRLGLEVGEYVGLSEVTVGFT